MAAFFLELFSEEIPARMQARAAEDLARLVSEALTGLSPTHVRTWYGPRRIALAAEVAASVAAVSVTERGPRLSAPEQALLGFLRKHGATKDQARQEGEYWVLEKKAEAIAASALIAEALPAVLRRMPWPKSMRWGGTSHFTWVRPLRRILCLLNGAVVPFNLGDGADDGHGLASAALTEGHRFHAPAAFAVSGPDDWAAKLREHRVLADAEDRKTVIAKGLARLAAERGVRVVEDPGLLDEVAGLVEWPVPLAGRIADEHRDLPPEVMRVSMRVNQRYFATRAADGEAAPWFLFVANIEAADGGATIVAGNERVLKARFADARHFWDLDRKTRLEDRVPALDKVTYHARLGTQGDRVVRLRRLAESIAPLVGAGVALADRAAKLAKADLSSGMVGEFPELQGVMGRYYALHDTEDAQVGDAIRDHYAPRGPADPVPTAPVSMAVALADKLDQLACFFAIDERPTGSGDPYALRRAALGVIRIIRENGLRLALLPLLDVASDGAANDILNPDGKREGISISRKTLPGTDMSHNIFAFDILDFLAERLRVQLRTEGARHDVLTAVFDAKDGEAHDDIMGLLLRTDAITNLLGQNIRDNTTNSEIIPKKVIATGRAEGGGNALDVGGASALATGHAEGSGTAAGVGVALLTAYRRAANILRIEERKDGEKHEDAPDPALLTEPAEQALHHALDASRAIEERVRTEDYAGAMADMATLRGPLDAFFENVTVNAPEPTIRRNRLRLLNQVRATMDRVADFSRIEG